ncbi:hypothetical protein [Brevundimonas sp.]|jgi:hypothetical protein|uniref:hypothetical protein n=1 Tax=Brevundimonas sp. TaxID=1871086 RepID=UPI003784A7E3
MKIYDYRFQDGANSGAIIQVDSERPEPNMFSFLFTNYDAVVSGIELGIIPQPEDMDKSRIGYEHPAFSATVRADNGSYRMQYYPLYEVLKELSGEEAEAIALSLAAQQPEISNQILAELI